MKNVTSFFNLLMVWWGDASPTSPLKTATAANGNVFARRSEESTPILIRNEDDLLKIQ